jgi:DNA-binding NarL/FixJ family response regulator
MPSRPTESRLEVLTAQELQIALTVATGLSNKEAAAQLFLSPKTVEHHLSAVYRKLEIASRGQLTRLVIAEESDAS